VLLEYLQGDEFATVVVRANHFDGKLEFLHKLLCSELARQLLDLYIACWTSLMKELSVATLADNVSIITSLPRECVNSETHSALQVGKGVFVHLEEGE
jgi:hypothetical protein